MNANLSERSFLFVGSDAYVFWWVALKVIQKNIFITDLPQESFSILDQVKENNGFASVTDNVGIGINPNEDFIKEFEVNE